MALSQDFLEQIHGMLVKPQQALSPRFGEVLEEWEAYFERMKIPKEKQMDEFNGIMRARVQAGQTSIAAPLEGTPLDDLKTSLFEPMAQFVARSEDKDGEQYFDALITVIMAWHKRHGGN